MVATHSFTCKLQLLYGCETPQNPVSKPGFSHSHALIFPCSKSNKKKSGAREGEGERREWEGKENRVRVETKNLELEGKKKNLKYNNKDHKLHIFRNKRFSLKKII